MKKTLKSRFWLRGQRKGVFWTLLISYLAVLILPAVVGIVFFERVSTVMVDNANRSNTAMLVQVKQIMDQKVRETDEVIAQISNNPKLLWLLHNGNKAESASDLYKFIDYIKDLYRYRQLNGTIDDFFIFLRGTEEVLTPVSKSPADQFFTKSQLYRGMDYEAIQRGMLTGAHFKTFLPSTWIQNLPGAERRYIPLLQSLPLGETKSVKGTLVILIDEQQIHDLLRQIETASQSDIYIVDDRNQLIMSTNETASDGIGSLLKQIDAGSDTIRNANGQETLLTYTSSSENGWTYITATPKSTVMAKVNEVKTAAIALLFVYLIVGAAGCYALAYRNYSPLQDVVNVIVQGKGKQTQGAISNESNEYAFIKNAISASLEEERQLRSTLLQQAPVLKANLLTRLIKGQLNAGEGTKAHLQTMGVHFASDSFVVILIDIDSSNGFSSKDSEEEFTLKRFVIANIGGELLQDDGYIVELSRDQFAVLMNPLNLAEDPFALASAFLSRLRGVVETRFNIKLATTVSNVHHGIAAIGQCYTEALIAMDYKLIRGRGSHIAYEEIRELKRGDYYYPLEMEIQLINLAKNGDYLAIERQLDELFDVNFRARSLSPEMGKCLIFDLFGTILKLNNTLGMTGKRLFEEGEDPMKAIAGGRSAEAMLEKVKGLFYRVCNGFTEERTGHGERLHSRITRFIDENYGDGMLSLTVIADHFHITSPYLSNFFKKHSGENITDYIAKVRIERAKQLLADRTLTISAIASQIGYSNDIGLIRLFKKYEGITPGKFRELMDHPQQKDSAANN